MDGVVVLSEHPLHGAVHPAADACTYRIQNDIVYIEASPTRSHLEQLDQGNPNDEEQDRPPVAPLEDDWDGEAEGDEHRYVAAYVNQE